jgi:hypothetical protein
MRLGQSLLGAALAVGFAALPLSPALAYYPCNPVTGVFGAAATVVGAAVTIGTAPLVILAGQRPHFVNYTCGYHDARYYHPYVGYDGPPQAEYAPPQQAEYAGPPQAEYAGPPQAEYAAPPSAYYGRPHRPRWYRRHGYAPPPPPPPGY